MKKLFTLTTLCLLLIGFFVNLNAQILPAERSSQWQGTGFRGPVPWASDYPYAVNIDDFGAIPDGVTPCDSAMTEALNDLNGAPGVMFFSEGTYLFKSNIVLHSNLMLKGVSSDKTTLIFDLPEDNDLDAIVISGSPSEYTSVLTEDAFKGSNSLELWNTTFLGVGDYILLTMDDEHLLDSDWAYGSVGQVIRINVIEGQTVISSTPLRLDYELQNNPKITKLDMISNVGIECLKIKRLDATTEQTSNIRFSYATQCWIAGVESELCNFAHVELNQSTNVSIKGSYFHGAHAYGGGGQAYGVLGQFATGQCLIEDNIFENLRHSMVLQAGANCNVFGYNYSVGAYWDEPSLPSNSAGDMVLHGNYPHHNLFEGNIGQNIVIDDSHGINGPYNTFFRNRAELYGIFMNFNPPSDSQNFIGNEINNSVTGLYLLNGDGHFEHGNNVKGTIRPSGTDQLTDTTYYYIPPLSNSLDSLNDWPTIGIPNTINTGTIPAKVRYESGKMTTCSTNAGIGVEELSPRMNGLNVYPNPSKDYVSILNLKEDAQYVIYDPLGRGILTGNISKHKNLIDIKNLNTGIYYIVIINNSKSTFSTTFIKH